MTRDLGKAIESPRRYSFSNLPRSITWSEVELMLQKVDRRSPVGKRDYAILLLLVTYGLRAREIGALSRDNAAQSRNQRLAALRTFFEYIGQRFPERLGQAQKVAAIPRKRAQPPETIFLERDEIEGTLAALPAKGRYALRDRALLVFLYNTGARVQEAADPRAIDVHFDPTPRVHLHGKGDKWRVCPLWTETSTLLKKLLSEQKPGGSPIVLATVYLRSDEGALSENSCRL
jgi:site-specific recombinase XerD